MAQGMGMPDMSGMSNMGNMPKEDNTEPTIDEID